MLIINANILTMEKKDYGNGYILIENGIIKDVGDMSSLSIQCDNVIDAGGHIVTPGLIDCHCHIGMWEDGLGFEGDDGNEDSEPLTPNMRALDSVNSYDDCFKEAVNAGITTVMTGPGSANPISGQWLAMKTFGRMIDEQIVKEPVGMKFALGENPKSIHNMKNEAPTTRMATVALMREQLIKTKRYMEDILKAEQDDEIDKPEYEPKCEALIPVLTGEIKAFIHAHRSDDICTAIRVAKEFNLDYVLIHCTEGYKIADILGEQKSNVVIGPIISDRSKPELKGLSVRNAAILAENNIDIAICTDHPEIPIQYLTLSCVVAIKNGLDRKKALEAITINAARICGVENIVGSIKVGKDADIVIWEKHPFDILDEPTHVIVSGKLVKG